MKKILVIDDDQDVREVVRITLKAQRPYEILEAEDGEQGLEIMKKEKPDLVICDLKMPRINGYQFVVKVSKNNELRGTPICVITSLTSDSDRNDEEWRKSLGVADFISKPFQPMELLRRVDELLSGETANA